MSYWYENNTTELFWMPFKGGVVHFSICWPYCPIVNGIYGKMIWKNLDYKYSQIIQFHFVQDWNFTPFQGGREPNFYFISGSPKTKFLLHFGVPNNQISLHFGVPHNQFHSILRSPTTDLESSGGVRENRSLTKGFTAHTKEHWGSHHILRSYIVSPNFPTNFSTQFSFKFVTQLYNPSFPTIFLPIFATILNFPTNLSS